MEPSLCCKKKLDTLTSPGVKFIVCDNNYVNSLLIPYFYMFLLVILFVMNPRMVLKLTCNEVSVFTCSLIGFWDVHII